MTQHHIGYQYGGMGGYHHTPYVNPIDKITPDQLRLVYTPFLGWEFASRSDLESALRHRIKEVPEVQTETSLDFWHFVTRGLRDKWVVIGEYHKDIYEKAHLVVDPTTLADDDRPATPGDNDVVFSSVVADKDATTTTTVTKAGVRTVVVKHKDGGTTTTVTQADGRSRIDEADSNGHVHLTRFVPKPPDPPATPASVLEAQQKGAERGETCEGWGGDWYGGYW